MNNRDRSDDEHEPEQSLSKRKRSEKNDHNNSDDGGNSKGNSLQNPAKKVKTILHSKTVQLKKGISRQ